MTKLNIKNQPGGIIFADDNNFDEAIEGLGKSPILICFHRGGSEFDKQLNFLLKLQYDHSYSIHAVIVNKNEAPRISRAVNILGTPTIILMKDKREYRRILGSVEDSELRSILIDLSAPRS